MYLFFRMFGGLKPLSYSVLPFSSRMSYKTLNRMLNEEVPDVPFLKVGFLKFSFVTVLIHA